MKHYLIVFMLSICVVACGDDSDDDGEHKETQDASTGDEDAGDAFGDVTCRPAGDGACQNADDCPKVESGAARMKASECGVGCLGMGDADEQATCAEACLVDETMLTTGCAECYVAIVACSREHCLSPCYADPESKECFDCQVANDCRSAFDECSGLPPVEMP
jgi:hypothetical protein